VTKRNCYFLLATSSAVALAMIPAAAMAQDTTPDTAPDTTEVGVQEQEAPAGTNEIVVSGIRRSLESAQSVKQDSDQIIDSVVAEDIGKLPDVTASESLARITGVTVTRDAGVAQGVRIRGLPDLTTTYNGREVFTAEGRFVQLQDFPSNSIARIDVYKSASADLLEAGLAGLVDVKSRKPFDFKGTRITGYLGGVHWYQSQRLGLEANGLFSTRWKTGIGEMGFLIEGSYADTKYIDSSRAVRRTSVTAPTSPAIRAALSFASSTPTMVRRRATARMSTRRSSGAPARRSKSISTACSRAIAARATATISRSSRAISPR
jgi:iron complex outermembrane receptor protein